MKPFRLVPSFSPHEEQFITSITEQKLNFIKSVIYANNQPICCGCGFCPKDSKDLDCYLVWWDGKDINTAKIILLCEACYAIKHFDKVASDGSVLLVNSKYSQEELINKCRNVTQLKKDYDEGNIKVLKKTAVEYVKEIKENEFNRNDKIKIVFTKAFKWKHRFKTVSAVKKIAITGGIGSGKTSVCKCFERLGVPVYYFDLETKKFLLLDEVKKEIKDLFGPDVLDESNNIVVKKLRELTFSDKSKTEALSKIMHPYVLADFEKWSIAHSDKTYIMAETAILFEYGLEKKFDYSIVVTCPEEIRIDRAMKRDGTTREDVLNKIKNQWPEEKKIELSDFTIENSETENALLVRAKKLHNELIEKCKKPSVVEI